MSKQTINTNYLMTISWLGDKIIDWTSAGQLYSLDGKVKQINKYHFSFNFDTSINSEDGRYAFIFTRLGTKGLLLKDGEILRETNRSYYQANVYEYPAAFLTINGRTYLAHCPKEYCRLDFEDVETGEIITDVPNRKPSDIFHSRLEVSPDNRYLMSKGWVWHPVDVVEVFDINACLANPLFLDESSLTPDVGAELSTASFIDDENVLIASSDEILNEEHDNYLPPKHVAIWNILTNKISKAVKVKGEFGNLFAINAGYAWDTYKYPKIINLSTGDVVKEFLEINTGEQCSSILTSSDTNNQIIFNRKNKKLAIKISNEKIEVLTPSF